MENSVTLSPKHYIEVTLVGNQTAESLKTVYEKALPLIDRLKFENKPILGLINMALDTGLSIGADKSALAFLLKVDYERVALCHVPHPEVTKGLIMAIGKTDNTQLFDNRAAAVKWLLAK